MHDKASAEGTKGEMLLCVMGTKQETKSWNGACVETPKRAAGGTNNPARTFIEAQRSTAAIESIESQQNVRATRWHAASPYGAQIFGKEQAELASGKQSFRSGGAKRCWSKTNRVKTWKAVQERKWST